MVMILHVVVIGVVGGLNIGVKMEYEGDSKPDVQVGSYWTFIVLTAFQI